MKKLILLCPLALTILSGCSSSSQSTDSNITLSSDSSGTSKKVDTKITICASELPHAKILKEAVAPVLKEKGYTLDVTVLEWTLQNPAVAGGEYDANYFQHTPYLNTYNAEASEQEQLSMVVKCHYEKLCLYASNLNHKTLSNGDRIEIVNDISNIERALLMLKDNGVIKEISAECYEGGEFKHFLVDKPNSQVTFADAYKDCKLTCIQESNLAISLGDYNFGVIPGNAALTGLGDDYAERIVFGEKVDDATLSLRANGVVFKSANKDSDKAKAIVAAFADKRVSDYIKSTFGESVTYHYEALI